MPSMAAARLSAGSLAEMQSHIFWLEVTRHSFMKSSARAAPARLAPRTQTTRLKHIARIDVRLFKGLGWTQFSNVSLLVETPRTGVRSKMAARGIQGRQGLISSGFGSAMRWGQGRVGRRHRIGCVPKPT